jgi:hypothetical protein
VDVSWAAARTDRPASAEAQAERHDHRAGYRGIVEAIEASPKFLLVIF